MGSTAAERFFALSIAGARRSVYITNSYFVPDDNFVHLLSDAARRGVDVRILTAGPRTDIPLVRRAGRAHYGPLLRRLARTHRLAVVSNFDYSPTALAILEAAGVRDLFAAIVVSDQVGWRKPRPDIFRHALAAAGADAARTLFVGDKAELDVADVQTKRPRKARRDE